MTLGGLFAGIGGFELAAIMAGIEPIWSNENDPWCCKVLRKNFNHEIIEADIRSLTADTECMGRETGPGKRIRSTKQKSKGQNIDNIREKIKLKAVDILTGGFPCQPFSHAGKRKGKDDNRYLWPEYLRLIRELRPPWIIAENVAGLISMENESPFEKWLFIGMESQNCFRRIYSRYIYRKRQTYVLNQIIEDLEKENYTIETYNIPACSVGAWHKRERIWIVAHNPNARIERMQQRENAIHGCPDASDTIKFNDDGTGYGTGSICGIGQKEAEIQGCKNVPDTTKQGLQESRQARKPELQTETKRRLDNRLTESSWWQSEPNVGRVAHGISGRVDRLKGLGNAIVPQVAYEIFKAIIEFDNNQRSV